MTLTPVSAADLVHTTHQVGGNWDRLKHKKLFLTGGTGFVGKWLLETLVHANRVHALQCEVTVLTRSPDRFRDSAPHLAQAKGVQLLSGDVRDFAFPDTAFDVIVHAATDVASKPPPVELLETCFSGTRRVLDMAARSRTQDFLLISSGAVYGRQPADLSAFPETWQGAPDPLATGSAYGTGKRTAECLAVQCGKQLGMRVKIARCFAFVGPYLPLDGHFAIGNFIRDALRGQAIEIQGDGTPLRSYLYAADLATWLWTILLRGQDGSAYNVGGDEVVSISELAHRVNDALNTRVDVVCRTGQPVFGPPERYLPDVSRARSELGLSQHINLREAIQRTARWAQAETTS